MSKNRKDIIRCPNCGAEYLAGEIYLPEEFLGIPADIEREATTHKIITDFGKPMNLNERYICDYCDTPFTVKAHVTFSVDVDGAYNFNEPYTTTVRKTALFLKED